MPQIKTSKFIGEKIKQRRRDMFMTQEELAEKIGVTYQQVQRYENGSNKLNVEQIQKIATHLNVSVIFFFTTEQKYAKEDREGYFPVEKTDKEYEKLLKSLKMVKSKKYKKLFIDVIKIILKVEKCK